MKTLNITTKEMYDFYLDSIKDIMWDNYIEGIESKSDMLVVLDSIGMERIDNIRDLFKSGYTMLLVGLNSAMIDEVKSNKEEVEIRVFNRENKLIGVIIDSEIVY